MSKVSRATNILDLYFIDKKDNFYIFINEILKAAPKI